MRSTMFRSAVAVVGSLALAGAALAADSRGERRASSSSGASRSATAVSRGSSVARAPAATPRAVASAPRPSATQTRSSAPATRVSSAPAPTRYASDQGHPRTAPAGSEPVGTAVPRGDSGGSWGGGSTTSSGGTETIQSTSGGHDRAGSSGRGRAVARGDRPRGDRTAIGTAETRTRPPYPGGGGAWDPGYWWNHPAYYWGYGGLGLGYFYYDPFWWGSGWGDPWGGYGGYYGGGGGGYSESVRRDPIGQLRLKVKPKAAQVYVDGALAGTVDDFDGTFERLDLAEGPHRVELRLEGHKPVSFEVNIIADELVTYRGRLENRD